MNQLTEIAIVLDRSGSMETVRAETVSGLNHFIEEQRKVPGDARVSLLQFNTIFDSVWASKPLADVPALTASDYVPRGMTALYDAIGNVVDTLGLRLANTPENERASKVLVVIVTDGLENSSRTESAASIKAKIKLQGETYSWTFVYIGANQDAILAARAVGIAAGNAVNYTSDAIGTQAMYSAASAATASLRCATSKSTSDFWDGKEAITP